jgi:hypothetical protein
MQTITSFHGSEVPPEELTALMADYMSLDQARTYRRLFVSRFGVLASVFGIVGFGFHLMPVLASWFSVALCSIAPAWAWIAELRCDCRLAKRLSQLPDASTQIVELPGT